MLFFLFAVRLYSPPDGPRAFSFSNSPHAAVACTGKTERAESILPCPIESRRGRSDDFREPVGGGPARDRPGLPVPDTRELEQLLYAGRQRAETFLSPEKTPPSRFQWIKRKVGKATLYYTIIPEGKQPFSNREWQRFEPMVLSRTTQGTPP